MKIHDNTYYVPIILIFFETIFIFFNILRPPRTLLKTPLWKYGSLSYPFHFPYILGQGPRPRPQSGGGPGPGRALAAALGPGPGSRAQECKKHGKDTLKYNMKYDKLK